MSSPETNPTHRRFTAEERQVLSIETIEEWREHQRKAIYKERLKAAAEGRGLADTSYIDEFAAKNDTHLDEFLASKGIDSDHPGYADVRDTLKQSSIDSINDHEWYSSAMSRGAGEDSESDRDKFDSSLRMKLAENEVDDADNKNDLDVAEKDITPEKFNELARKKQEAHAALIQTPHFKFARRKKAQAAYDKASEDYDNALHVVLSRDINGVIRKDDNSHETEINSIINSRLNGQNKDQHGVLIETGGKRAQLLEKYSTFSTKKKIAYGLGLGAAGAAAGFVVGAAGAGAAAVIAGLRMYGVSRSVFLGKADIYKEPSDNALQFRYDSNSSETAAMQAVEYARRHDILVIEQAEKTKKRALKIGIGAAALTGAAGALGAWAHSALDAAEHVNANDGHWRAGYLEHIGSSDVDANLDPKIDGPNDLTLDDAPPGWSEDHLDRMNDAAKEMADKEQAHTDAVEKYINNHAAGNIVTKGEGWNHTFKEFGVTGSKQDDLLREIGPELEKMGEAYRTEDGFWGISHPGELSDKASKLIVETADQHNWLSGNVSVVSELAPEAVQHVQPGEGILHTLHDAGVENPTLSDVASIQDQLVTDGAAYTNGPDGYAGLNLPSDGHMNANGVGTVMDYADNKQLDNSYSEQVIGSEGDATPDLEQLTGADLMEHDVHSYLEWSNLQHDIHEMSDLLKDGNLDTINHSDEYQDALKYIQADLKGINYPNSDTPIISRDYSVGGEHWKLNAVPEGSHMPASAVNALIAYEQRQFTLAA
ncbi:MAG: hypothetical protein ABIQ64_02600 [Candidatus Saccharimonadales bacterium]